MTILNLVWLSSWLQDVLTALYEVSFLSARVLEQVWDCYVGCLLKNS